MTMAAPQKAYALPAALAFLMPGQTKTGASGDGGAAAAVFIGLLQQLSGPAVPGLKGAQGDGLAPDGKNGSDQAAAVPTLAVPGVNLAVLAPNADGLRPNIAAQHGVDNGAQPPLTVTAKLALAAHHVQPLAIRPLALGVPADATVRPLAPSGDGAPQPSAVQTVLSPPVMGSLAPDTTGRVPATPSEGALRVPAVAAAEAGRPAGASGEVMPTVVSSRDAGMPSASAPEGGPSLQPLPDASASATSATPARPEAVSPANRPGEVPRLPPVSGTLSPAPVETESLVPSNGRMPEEPSASASAPARAQQTGDRPLAADALSPVNLMKPAEAGLVLVPREAAPGPGAKPAADAGRPGEAKRIRPVPVTALADMRPDTAGASASPTDRLAARLGLAQGAGRSDGPASPTAPAAPAHDTSAGTAPRATGGAPALPADASAAPAPRTPLQMPAASPPPPAADPQPLPQSLAAALDPARMGLASERFETTGLLQAAQAGTGLERAGTAQPAAAPQPAPQTGLPPAAQQLGLALQYRVGRGETRFALRLDPPELGRIEVALKLHGDGRVDAVVKAEHGHTLDLLQRDARMLERAFHQLGLKPEGGIQFTTGQGSQHHGQQAFAEGGLSGQHHGNGQPAAQEDAAAMTRAAATGAAGSTDEIPSEEAAGPAMREAVIGIDVEV